MNTPSFTRAPSPSPVAAIAVLVFAGAACDGEPAINPVSTPATPATAPSDAGTADAQLPPVIDAGPVVRTIIERDPFGVLDPTNLLHDGDFELSAPNTMQYPWLGLERGAVITGAACKSGVRCLSLTPSSYAAGAFVWPDAPQATVSFYAHPTGTDCANDIAGMLVAFDQHGDSGYAPQEVAPETPAPVSGFCHFKATVDVPKDPGYHFYMLVLAARDQAKGPVVFDDASLRASTATASTRSHRTAEPLPKDLAALISRARAELRDKLPPRPPKPIRPVHDRTGKSTVIWP